MGQQDYMESRTVNICVCGYVCIGALDIMSLSILTCLISFNCDIQVNRLR